jgi:hypothetical protein
MKRPPKWKRFWLCCRWGIRGCRIVLLLVVLFLLAGFIWFNQIGMPDFAKTLLQDELKSRGLEVEFRRMYWKWFQGIVTEGLTVRPSDGRIGPSIFIKTADVDLDLKQLSQGELSVRSIELFQGGGKWSVAVSNEPPRLLAIKNLSTDIRFLPNDLWQLTHFSANIQGIDVKAAGVITNASLARRQSASKRRTRSRKENRDAVQRAEAQIYQALTSFDKFRFAVPPSITVKLNADARERGEIDAHISGTATRLKSPYGDCRQFSINGQVTRGAETNAPIKASISLGAAALKTVRLDTRNARAFVFFTLNPAGNWDILWNTSFKQATGGEAEAEAEYVGFEGNASSDALNTNAVHANISLTLNGLKSPHAQVGSARITASVAGNHQSRLLRRAEFKARLTDFTRDDLRAQNLNLDGVLQSNKIASASTNLAPALRRLAPWNAEIRIDGRNLGNSRTHLDSMALDVNWAAPELRVNSLSAELGDGSLNLSATANADDREIDWQLQSDFSLTHIAHLLGPQTEKYLAQYVFKKAPKIKLAGSLRLPPGELHGLNWKTDLEPSLTAGGSVAAKEGNYRGLEFLTATTDLAITNQSIVLPNLFVARPEGAVHLTYTNHLVTRDYAFGIDSLIDPRSLAPLLGESERKALAMLDLQAAMPLIRGTLWGRWGDLKRTGFDALARMTNIAVRGQKLDRLTTGIAFTNSTLVLTDTELRRPEGRLHTRRLSIDTAKGRIYLTNVHCGIDFMVLPSIIGPKTAKAVSRYHFLKTPKIVINGEVSTHRDSEKDSDLHFDLTAPHFHWFKFNFTNATARLDWVTNRLWIDDFHADFYGGSLDGDLMFDFDPPVGNDFTFDLGYTNAGLRPLIADLSNPTNRLEGSLTGDIHLTSANTGYWDSWQGHGNIILTNAILWDIPVFGVVSPIMNRILPGLNLGNSRAKEAAGKFVMTNSIIHTSDMIIQSPPARLYYDGTIDFDANINARVQAKMFRDKFLMTRLLDAFTAPITKILEHRVTGTLANPKTSPINELPKIFLAPLKPLQAVSDILKGKAPRKSSPAKKNGDR